MSALRLETPGTEYPTLKQAMRNLVGAVCVITSGRGPERTGATVTSAQSLSVDPETMLVSINRDSSTWHAIRRNGAFCVNVLAADQQAVAERFSGRNGERGAARYLGADWKEASTGSALLSNALASIDCEVEHVLERHSHALVFGAVRAVVLGSPRPALLYAHGRYGSL